MLEINGKVCLRRCPQTFTIQCFTREFNSRHYNILHCLLWGSLTYTSWSFNQSNVPASQELGFCLITTSKNNWRELHISWPTPQDSLTFHYSILVKTEPHCHTAYIVSGDNLHRNSLQTSAEINLCTVGSPQKKPFHVHTVHLTLYKPEGTEQVVLIKSELLKTVLHTNACTVIFKEK